MKIKELTAQLHISACTIRFYEKKGMIAPVKHPDNGYRYFTEREAVRLRMIMALREFGMSVEEVKSVLDRLDQGRRDEAHHELELQRSVMFTTWMDHKRRLEAADQMIERLRRDSELEWEEMFQLAGGLKRRRELREDWFDGWDFDSRAAVHDIRVSLEEGENGRHPAYRRALRLIVQRVAANADEYGLDAGTGNLAAENAS
ncbi:MerR family transcriptional regulator [Paenibacillus sp. NPDC055715]